ncbi:PIN domain-containing protein [Candidatus Collierbacteria bacterium]|nr:PIN domain-containing protein [Candidatus Collierbacteria bacterium]
MGRKIIHYLLDTNVLVRYLVRDEESQYQQIINWLKDAEAGKIKIIIPPIVVAETCFVLESFYKKQRNEISDSMVVFLSQRWIKVVERNILLSLWKDYKAGFHFVDSFLRAVSHQNSYRILSFDKKLLRMNSEKLKNE